MASLLFQLICSLFHFDESAVFSLQLVFVLFLIIGTYRSLFSVWLLYEGFIWKGLPYPDNIKFLICTSTIVMLFDLWPSWNLCVFLGFCVCDKREKGGQMELIFP